MGWTTGIQFLAGTMMAFFSLCHHIHDGSGAHLASYPRGSGGSYPRDKVTKS